MIGRQIDQFVEQNAGFRQHPLDLVGRVRNRARRGVDAQLRPGRRLVIVADPGERLQRAGARLGVMALGVAALADLGRRCDIDLAERRVGDAARGGTIIRRR